MASVQLEQVSKVFGDGTAAVRSLDLKVQDSELLVLLGPSGCGKTTTLRMIAGLTQPTNGEIRIADRAVTKLAPAKRNVGMVFQEDALYPHLNVWNNLAFVWQLRHAAWWRQLLPGGLKTKPKQPTETPIGEPDQRIIQAARWLGLEDLLDRMPHELSGGQRRRVALGRAVVQQADVLLLDEPLANLDTALRDELKGELSQLHQRVQQTMIVVTHDQSEAMTLAGTPAGRLAVMHDGELLQVGRPLDVYHQPKSRTVASLLGGPTINLLHGTVERQGETWWFVDGAWRVRLADAAAASIPPAMRGGQAAELGVRPEDVRVTTTSMGAEKGSVADSLAKIVMVESLGDSAVLRLQSEKESSNNHEIKAKLTTDQQFQPGDQVLIEFQRCHWFDAATGNRIAAAN